MVKVSVLMPVYNTKEEYLKESIESILNQTFTDFELIILDDGSENDIEKVVKTYDDNRIKFYKNENNLKVAKTRNKLMNLSQGEYIAWQDSDDISYPDRLEKQVDFLNKNLNISAVGSNMVRFPAKKIVKNPEFPKILDFMGGCVFSQGSAMIRMNDFKKYDLKYDESLVTSEDYDLWSRAVCFLNIATMQEVLLKYRRVSTSLCHSKNDYAYEIDKNIKKRLLDTLTKDVKLQDEVLLAVSKYYTKQAGFFERIFSIRNEWRGDKKVKILTFLGIKMRIK